MNFSFWVAMLLMLLLAIVILVIPLLRRRNTKSIAYKDSNLHLQRSQAPWRQYFITLFISPCELADAVQQAAIRPIAWIKPERGMREKNRAICVVYDHSRNDLIGDEGSW